MAEYTWTTFPISGSANFETTARAVLELWRANTDDMEAKLGSIADGTINAANITIPSGKTLNASAGTLTLAADQISGDSVEGGTINAVTVNTLTIGTVANGSVTVGSGKTLNVSAGTLTLAADQISGDKVEGGTINAVTINTLTSTTVNATTLDTNVAAAGVTLSGVTLAADGTDANIDINITPKGTGEVNITKVDIDAGTIDGATISTSNVTVGSGKTIDVSAGTLTLANDQISGDKIHGGTISAFASTGIDDNADAVAITIDSSERVGIGTTSPLSRLHVSSSGNGIITALSLTNPSGTTADYGTAIAFGATTDASAAFGKIAVANRDTGNGSQGYMSFYTRHTDSLTEKIRIASSGEVGIGTTSPVNKLDIEGAVAIGATYSGTSTAPTNGLIVEGNVGIGHTSPVVALDINGDNYLRAATTELRTVKIGYGRSGNGEAILDLIGDATYTNYGLRLSRGSAGENSYSSLYHRGTGSLYIYAMDAGSILLGSNNSTDLSIISGGNVGIGTTSPVNKLDIEGAVAIGATYSGTSTAPTNGLIVEGNVGIGTVSPNANAILDVTSTTKAFMPPRMTTTQRDAVSSPAAGMVIYNTTTGVLNFHNGTAWGAV